MKEIDFSECEFIEQCMKFYSKRDFYKNAIIIKYLFKKLSRNGRIFYRYYVYANVNIGLKEKHIIWDYLNDYKTIEDIAKFL